MFISSTEKQQVKLDLADLQARVQLLEQVMGSLKDHLKETSRTLNDPAPYGYRKNGQPKKKPGRPAK
jgi:hypothetical protein